MLGKFTPEIGDSICVQGRTYKIAKIISKDHYEREGWFLEFLDPQGHYHYWKQYCDGGEIIKQPQQKRLVNSYGTDCTDLFRKYGYGKAKGKTNES